MAWRMLLPALLAAAAPVAGAQAVATVYRCTAADGSVSFRNDSPCPSGSRQQEYPVDVPPPLPAHAPQDGPTRTTLSEARPLRPVTAVPRTDDAAGEADAAPPETLSPPPPLFACVRWDGERYHSPVAEPEPQCRPLTTVGIGGVAGIGAGAACEKVRDSCEPVPDDQLCAAWDARLRETEFRWRFAGNSAEAARHEQRYGELADILAASSCAAGTQNP